MTHITVEYMSEGSGEELFELMNKCMRAEERLSQQTQELREQTVARQRAEVRLADARREIADLRRELQWATQGLNSTVC